MPFLFAMFSPRLFLTGLILVLTIKPGAGYAVFESESVDEESFSTIDALLDLIRWEEGVYRDILLSRHIHFQQGSCVSQRNFTKCWNIWVKNSILLCFSYEEISVFYKVTWTSSKRYVMSLFCVAYISSLLLSVTCVSVVYRNMTPANLILACFQQVCFSWRHTTIHTTHSM